MGSDDLPLAARRTLGLRWARPRFCPSIPYASDRQSKPQDTINLRRMFGAGKGNRTPDSTLGRSRLTTKLYPRVITPQISRWRRPLVYGLLGGLASLLAVVSPATAEETAAQAFSAEVIQSGQTFKLEDGAKVGIFPGAITTDTTITWTVSEETIPVLPAHREILGKVYRLTVAGPTEFTAGMVRPAAVVLPYGSSFWNRQIWQYDRVAKSWSPLRTKINTAQNFASAGLKKTDVLVAVVENRKLQEGIASWYCRNYCSQRYPILHATSNDFPVGSMVRVTSTETGRTVDVKLISKWGQPAGRVVDLSWAAYSALRTTNKGVTRVTVKPVPAKVLGISVSTKTLAPKIETIPALTVEKNNSRPFPAITARGFYVMDQGTGTGLAEYNPDGKQPIASLTKLMTAVVFLDTQPNLKDDFVYAVGDGTGMGHNTLLVRPGDRLLIRDLFYSSLVGSANNAATALIRASGLSREEFVVRMNAKATAWGMTNTTFTEASGLSEHNVSTPRDLAILASKSFHEYEPIRFVTVKSGYSFTASMSGLHSFKTTDKLIGSPLLSSALTITGGKTGYIDESKYTYIIRTKNSQGAQVITVLLGTADKIQRFRDAAAIANWAFANHTWK